MSKREYRTINAEMRVSKERTIEGRAVVYNQTVDLGYFREKVAPGAFTRAIAEKQDIRFLVNHDPNLILGRTANGTLSISQDEHGVNFSVDLPDTQLGKDTHTLIKRGDLSQCSFGFIVTKESVDQSGDTPIRTIEDLDCFDLSTVAFPAYPTTSVSARSIEEVAKEIQARSNTVALKKFKRDDEDGDPEGTEEQPTADPVADGDFHEAMGLHHVDESSMNAEQATRCRSLAAGTDDDDLANHLRSSAQMHDEHSDRCMDMADLHFEKASDCRDMGDEAERAAKAGKKTKRVAGEDLTAGDFLYVGDPDKTATWSLPWKFSTDAKTKSHLRNALARFDQDEVIPASAKAAVHAKLVAKCKEYGIDVTETKSAGLDIETAKRRTYVASLSL